MGATHHEAKLAKVTEPPDNTSYLPALSFYFRLPNSGPFKYGHWSSNMALEHLGTTSFLQGTI